jgi:hypothetical protein
MTRKKVVQSPVSVMGRVERQTRDDAQALGLNVSEIIRKAVEQAVYDALFIFPEPESPWDAIGTLQIEMAKVQDAFATMMVNEKKLKQGNEMLEAQISGLWREYAEIHTKIKWD